MRRTKRFVCKQNSVYSSSQRCQHSHGSMQIYVHVVRYVRVTSTSIYICLVIQNDKKKPIYLYILSWACALSVRARGYFSACINKVPSCLVRAARRRVWVKSSYTTLDCKCGWMRIYARISHSQHTLNWYEASSNI